MRSRREESSLNRYPLVKIPLLPRRVPVLVRGWRLSPLLTVVQVNQLHAEIPLKGNERLVANANLCSRDGLVPANVLPSDDVEYASRRHGGRVQIYVQATQLEIICRPRYPPTGSLLRGRSILTDTKYVMLEDDQTFLPQATTQLMRDNKGLVHNEVDVNLEWVDVVCSPGTQ